MIHETHGHKTHPMSEKIRGALFNALGDIEGLTVLDAFAGTGAVAVEAISRGASKVWAIDSDKEASRTIIKNINELKLTDKVQHSQANISSWLDNNPDMEFDIVIADPPYDNFRQDLIDKALGRLKFGGVGVVSMPVEINYQAPSINYQILATKNYGDAKLLFYRKK